MSNSAWKTILRWDFIKKTVKQVIGFTLDEKAIEDGLKIFEKSHSEDEIYEMEIDLIEKEIIEIFIKLKSGEKLKGKNPNNKRIFIELDQDQDLNYLAQMFGQKYDQDDDDDDDANSNMYI
ncbi:MAG: hypothetical protein ACTSWY_08930 [Promethearchaeota archaeon]